MRETSKGHGFLQNEEIFRAKVLFGCRVKPLEAIHLDTLETSDAARLSIFENNKLLINRAVSSAKSLGVVCKAVGRSLIYNRNNRGPKIEPWGIPYVIS